jgi:hypothetical protein
MPLHLFHNAWVLNLAWVGAMTFGKVTYGKIPQLLEKFPVISSLRLLPSPDPFSVQQIKWE